MTDEADFETFPARRPGNRFQPGVSGNPQGRPKGCRNKHPARKRALPADIKQWTPYDAEIFSARVRRSARNREDAKVELITAWLASHAPQHSPGYCPACNRPLDLAPPNLHDGPVRLEGVWVHWSCAARFLRRRWDEAREAVRKLGVAVNYP